jgi:hypothetical protein
MRKFQISTLRKNNVKLRPVLSIKKVSQTFIYQEFGRVLIGLVSKFFVVKNVRCKYILPHGLFETTRN